MILTVLLFSCQELIPGELVIGDEVPAQVMDGLEGFGQSVELDDDVLVASSPLKMGPLDSELTRVDVHGVRRVGIHNGEPWAWREDGSIVYGDEFQYTQDALDATAVDRCPEGPFVYAYGVGESVACSDEGVLRTQCIDSICSVHVDDGPPIDEVSPGGDLAWFDGQPCWGDPNLGNEKATGRVACADGLETIGLEGDHLGVTLGAGRAAGRFNRHIVPPRLRIVPLADGDVWVIDRAAENSRVSLSADGGRTVVGVPQFRQGESRGRIFVVNRGE